MRKRLTTSIMRKRLATSIMRKRLTTSIMRKRLATSMFAIKIFDYYFYTFKLVIDYFFMKKNLCCHKKKYRWTNRKQNILIANIDENPRSSHFSQ
jgi:hypothetical protein